MYAEESAHDNPVYTMNEAYTSNGMDYVKVPVNQDVHRLTENIY